MCCSVQRIKSVCRCVCVWACSVCALQQPLFFQLHKASLEVTKTREDMKSLQTDLTSADKEISVRKSLEMPLRFQHQKLFGSPR